MKRQTSNSETMTAQSDGGLKVFIAHSAPVCGKCRKELGRHSWITLAQDQGAHCLECAGLADL